MWKIQKELSQTNGNDEKKKGYFSLALDDVVF